MKRLTDLKYIAALLFALSMLLMLSGCDFGGTGDEKGINATLHGVGVANSPEENTRALQALVDSLAADGGGTVYIPSGVYRFAAGGSQTIGQHAIKLRSGVSFVGDGESTVLMPVGESYYGLDMFYFNDLLDVGEPIYLEGCSFEGFVIDGAETSSEVYTSAGKGFMINLFSDCHLKDVTIKNTDATGFGIDCPINSSIRGCTAIACGKAATEDQPGASGFGIGYGYSPDESLTISDCSAYDSRRFGFFFEHQGRFNSSLYSALPGQGAFTVTSSSSSGDLYGFGGIAAASVSYIGCNSIAARRSGFYFEDSVGCSVSSSATSGAGQCGLSILATGREAYLGEPSLSVVGLDIKASPTAVSILSEGEARLASISLSSVDVNGATVGVFSRASICRLVIDPTLYTSQKNDIDTSRIGELTTDQAA
ncbi:MAG: right-handed parallel beta-helix repeat-containing protein [Clostridia bacterium]|nr:right-handed parallel beta-helix repeat-containing protein [Clostridia bacterium]